MPDISYHGEKGALIAIALMAVGFVSEVSRHLLDNYDAYFKILTLFTLGAAAFFYIIKFIKWCRGAFLYLKNKWWKKDV